MKPDGGGEEDSEQSPEQSGIYLHAEVSGQGRATLAGRDIHVHYADGVRRVESPGTAGECPYPGLAAFTAEQSRWFFGREALTAELAERLADRLTRGGVLVVAAPSGAGKSSVLRAGLLPAISHRGVLPAPGSQNWPQIVLTPTAHPMTALTRAITESCGKSRRAANPDSLIDVLSADLAARGPSVRIILLVDQLEELFTLCQDNQERCDFLGLLDRIAMVGADGYSLGLVICGLRADSYARCVEHPELREALRTGQVIVGPMSESELRHAVLLPARRAGLDVEPGLVDLLLRDLGAAPSSAGSAQADGEYEVGRLPLLAHALRTTWQQRSGSTLTVDGYRTTGGIRHAVATTAERAFGEVGAEGQIAARTLLLRLVRIGDGVEDARRTLALSELLGDGADQDATGEVLDAFTRGRLLTREQDTVTITHEVLLRVWPRLRAWIDEDRAGNLLRQELEDAAASWDRDGREAGMLLRGNRLELTRAWLADASHARDLTGAAQALCRASIRQQTRTARRRRIVTAMLCALTLVAGSAAVYAFQQRAHVQAELNQVTFNNLLSESEQLRASGNLTLSGQLSLIAMELRHDRDVRDEDPDLFTDLVNAGSTVVRPPSDVSPVSLEDGDVVTAFSPTGAVLAVGVSGAITSALELWSVANPAHATLLATLYTDLSGAGPIFSSLAFSPDGRTLVGGLSAGDILWWNIANPAKPVRLKPDIYDVTCVEVLAPDVGCDNPGQVSYTGPSTLAVVEDPSDHSNSYVQLYDVSNPPHSTPTGARLDASSSERPQILATDAQSHLIVTSPGGVAISVWNVSNPSDPLLISDPALYNQSAFTAVISPATHAFALQLADGSNNIQLWGQIEVARSRELSVFPGGTGVGSTPIAFSPDGKTLALVGVYGVQLWNISSPSSPVAIGQPVSEAGGEAQTLSFDRTGDLIASGTTYGVIVLWDLDVSRDVQRICRTTAALNEAQWRQYVPGLAYQAHLPVCT